MWAISKKKEQGGYVALIAVIVLSVILFVLVLSTHSGSFTARFIIDDAEQKEQSLQAALGCLETVRGARSKDQDLEDVVLIIGSAKCKVVEDGNSGTADVCTVARDVHTYLRANFTGGPSYKVVSIEERAETCVIP